MDDAGFREHVTQEVRASFVVPFVRQAGRRVIDLEAIQSLNIAAADMVVATRSAREWTEKLIL